MPQFTIVTKSLLKTRAIEQTHEIEAPSLLHALMLAEVHAQDHCENEHDETSEMILLTQIDKTTYPHELPISQTHIIDPKQLTLLLYTASDCAYDYDTIHELLAASPDETYDLIVRLAFELTQVCLTPALAVVASQKIASLAANVFLFNAQQDNEWTSDALDALDAHQFPKAA